MAIIKHITYRCDICGKECEDCITPHSIHFNHYLDNTLLRYEYINKFDVCVECNGHGDLKDIAEVNRLWQKGYFDSIASALIFAPTIVEADKEAENEDSN